MKRSEALRLREIIEQAATSLDDKIASEAVVLCQMLKYDGSIIKAGTRINWNGTLKRASVDLWDLEIYNPDNAPTAWEDILYRKGIRIIPNPITVGTMFSKGELGWWGDVLYKSVVDNNIYTPEQYADNWIIV